MSTYKPKMGDKVRGVRNPGQPNATVSCQGVIVGFSNWKVWGLKKKEKPTVLVEKPWGEVEEMPIEWVRPAFD